MQKPLILLAILASLLGGCATNLDHSRMDALSSAASSACTPQSITLPGPNGSLYSIPISSGECSRVVTAIAGMRTSADRWVSVLAPFLTTLVGVGGQVYSSHIQAEASVDVAAITSAASSTEAQAMWGAVSTLAGEIQGTTNIGSHNPVTMSDLMDDYSTTQTDVGNSTAPPFIKDPAWPPTEYFTVFDNGAAGL